MHDLHPTAIGSGQMAPGIRFGMCGKQPFQPLGPRKGGKKDTLRSRGHGGFVRLPRIYLSVALSGLVLPTAPGRIWHMKAAGDGRWYLHESTPSHPAAYLCVMSGHLHHMHMSILPLALPTYLSRSFFSALHMTRPSRPVEMCDPVIPSHDKGPLIARRDKTCASGVAQLKYRVQYHVASNIRIVSISISVSPSSSIVLLFEFAHPATSIFTGSWYSRIPPTAGTR